MKRFAVLGSTRGTSFSTMLHLMQEKNIASQISLVLSNKIDAGILEKAKQAGIEYDFLDPKNLSREIYDETLSEFLLSKEIDYVVLIGYMRILSQSFVAKWQHKIINVHPSLLPNFAGLMNEAVHQAVLHSGIKETGCTVHLVTEQVDEGPILIQKKCAVFTNDTVESLKARVQALEGIALVEAIEKLP